MRCPIITTSSCPPESSERRAMQPSDFFRIVRRQWHILVAVPLLCLAAAGAYVATAPTVYTAHTRLYVSMATGTSVNDSYQGGLAAQQRMASYSYIAGGTTVAERVIDDLGLTISPEELQKKITVVLPPATTLLDISVSAPSPRRRPTAISRRSSATDWTGPCGHQSS